MCALPTVAAEKPADEWQAPDITLMDRYLIVKLDEQTIINNQPVMGCTGGALWSDESRTGPIYFQGAGLGEAARNEPLRVFEMFRLGTKRNIKCRPGVGVIGDEGDRVRVARSGLFRRRGIFGSRDEVSPKPERLRTIGFPFEFPVCVCAADGALRENAIRNTGQRGAVSMRNPMFRRSTWSHSMRNIAAFGFVLMGTVAAYAASDYQFTMTNSGTTSWTLQAVSSSHVYSGTIPAPNNPTITLIVGNRFEVTNVPAAAHPFQILGKGSNAGADVVLLSTGATVGSLESDADIAWTDDLAGSNQKAEFTVTQALVTAMRNGGNVPGYRCSIHPSTMRGNFDIIGERIMNPIPAEIPLGDITIELETVAQGLVSPLGAAFPDDGSGRMFVYDQPGQVWVVAGGVRLPTPLLDVSDRIVTLSSGSDERGLLGFAVHPDFASNPKVYTFTSEPPTGTADFTVPMTGSFNHQDVIAEWTVDPGNADLIDIASRRELLRNNHPQSNHNGGTLRFGPDGNLYFCIGDGGAGDDQGAGHAATGNGQDKSNILGKIMRINVDGGGTPSANGQYGIPADNPFVGDLGAVHEIYAYGLRNPYHFSFDPLTGDLYVGDVGQNNIEEVDLITAGGNYGWHVKEGSFFFNPNGPLAGFVTDQPVVFPVPPNLIDPIAEYDHAEGRAVVGGSVYRGASFVALQGRYVFGDLAADFGAPSGRLLYLDGLNQIKELTIGVGARPFGLWLKGFAQDLEGNLYVCGSELLGPTGTTGKVLKIVAAGGPTANFSATPLLGESPLNVQFTDLSDPGSSAIVDWEWDFGDGQTSHEQNPSHDYLTLGPKTVSLTVTTAVAVDVEIKANMIDVVEDLPATDMESLILLVTLIVTAGVASASRRHRTRCLVRNNTPLDSASIGVRTRRH